MIHAHNIIHYIPGFGFGLGLIRVQVGPYYGTPGLIRNEMHPFLNNDEEFRNIVQRFRGCQLIDYQVCFHLHLIRSVSVHYESKYRRKNVKGPY